MLGQLGEDVRVFSGLSFVDVGVFELFMDWVSERFVLLLSPFFFFFLLSLLSFLIFFLKSCLVIINQFVSIWTINACCKPFLFLKSRVKEIQRNRISLFFCNFWFVILFCVIHKLKFWLEELNQSLSKFICSSFSKLSLIRLRRHPLWVFLKVVHSILLFKYSCIFINYFWNSEFTKDSC